MAPTVCTGSPSDRMEFFWRYLEETKISKKRVDGYVRYARRYGCLLEADVNEVAKMLLEVNVHKR